LVFGVAPGLTGVVRWKAGNGSTEPRADCRLQRASAAHPADCGPVLRRHGPLFGRTGQDSRLDIGELERRRSEIDRPTSPLIGNVTPKSVNQLNRKKCRFKFRRKYLVRSNPHWRKKCR